MLWGGKLPSVTESPWYWIYVFCTAALIGLVLLGPKVLERQLLAWEVEVSTA